MPPAVPVLSGTPDFGLTLSGFCHADQFIGSSRETHGSHLISGSHAYR
jgi:hypothetical protein